MKKHFGENMLVGLRNRLFLLAIFLFTSFLALSPALASAPMTRTVCPEDGACDYRSIEDAIGSSAPYDVILVGPGVYEESFSVEKPITIKGNSAADTILRPSGESAEYCDGGCDVLINASDVTISGVFFDLDGADDSRTAFGIKIAYGAPVITADNVTIEDCIIEHSTSPAISNDDANPDNVMNNLSVRRNTFRADASGQETAAAVLLYAGATSGIKIEENTIGGRLYNGIRIGTAGVSIASNTISTSYPDSSTNGIFISDINGNTVQDATLSANLVQDFGNGIAFDRGENIAISSQTFSNVANLFYIGNASSFSVTGSDLFGGSQVFKRTEMSSTAEIDASANWWGTATETAIYAMAGDYVDFSPWLAVGDADASVVGFQADKSILYAGNAGIQVGYEPNARIGEALAVNRGIASTTINFVGTINDETLDIRDRSNITILGQGMYDSELTSGGTRVVWLRRAENIRIDGFRLRDTDYGFYISDSKDIYIQHDSFFGFNMAMIYIDGVTTGMKINYNDFNDNENKILENTSKPVDISKNYWPDNDGPWMRNIAMNLQKEDITVPWCHDVACTDLTYDGAPIARVNYPTAALYGTNDLIATTTIDDNDDGSRIDESRSTYALDNVAKPISGVRDFELNNLPDGEHSLSLDIYDNAGNRATSSVAFAIDTLAPAFSIDSPADNDKVNATKLKVDFSYLDPHYQETVIGLYDSTGVLVETKTHSASGNTSTSSASVEFDIRVSDTYSLRATSSDTLGHKTAATVSGITVTRPTVPPSGGSGGGSNGGGGGSPVPPPAPTGYNYSATINDNALQSTSSEVIIRLGYDGAAKKMSISNDPEFFLSAVTDIQPSAVWTLPLGFGERTVFARLYDSTGRIIASLSDGIVVVPPAVKVTPTIKPQVLGVKLFSNGTLIRGKDKRIYVIVKGKKALIKNLRELWRYRGKKINNVMNDVLNSY